MRALAILGVVLLLGMVGVVFHHGSDRESASGSAPRSAPVSLAPVGFLSRGEAVDIDASVPDTGWAIVEFTADW